MNRRFVLLAVGFLLVTQASRLRKHRTCRSLKLQPSSARSNETDLAANRQSQAWARALPSTSTGVLHLKRRVISFPRRCDICRNAGNMSQAVCRLKVGKRFENWGIFAKARPGWLVSAEASSIPIFIGRSPNLSTLAGTRITSFATDFGGVLSFIRHQESSRAST